MAPKRNAREPTPSSTGTTQSSTTSAGSVPVVSKSRPNSNQSAQEIAIGIWQSYLDKTPQRTKLIDAFMGFLVVVGVLQFIYCVIVGNYACLFIFNGYNSNILLQPFNAFLSGFSATVGQFVLTASLRIQTNGENKAEFSSVSPER